MNALTLFAGAGGADLGLRRAGFTHLACVEGDATACATLRAAGFPAAHAWIGGPGPDGQPAWQWDGTPVDLLWASPPCQPYSRAGKRLGASDARDGWPATLATIEQIRPRWAIIENVRGAPIEAWEQQIRALGYATSAALLDAADWGLPSHRTRWYLVAGPTGSKWPTPTHHGPKVPWLLRGNRKPWVSFGEALGLTGAVRATRASEADKSVFEREEQVMDGPSQCIGATYTGSLAGQPYVLAVKRGREAGATWEETKEGSPSTCIRTSAGGSSIPSLLFKPCTSICATESKGHTNPHLNRGRNNPINRASDSLFLATGRRRLTWQECATLVGFPADYPFQGTTEARYRQIGNAVAPVMAEVLARNVPKEPQ